jgi:hypothetical protein
MTEPPFLGPQTLPWGRRLAANLSSVGSLGFFGGFLSYCGASDGLILAVLLALAVPINLAFGHVLAAKPPVEPKCRAMGAGRG